MPVTAAQIGYGTQLKLGNGASPEVFTVISEEVELGGIELNFPKVKATNLLSPGTKNEYVAGIGDYSTLEVKCNMTRANVFIIKNWINALAAGNWKYVFPTPLSLVMTFSGVPNNLKYGSITPDGLTMISFGIQLTGDITYS
jgi:hypothetical protein